MLDAFTRRPTDIRDKALIWLAYRHRLKLVQLLALDSSQYDPERRLLTVAASPRAPAATLSVDSESRNLLERWMATRAKLGIRPFAPLFCTTTADSLGQPVKPSYLRNKLPSMALAAGVGKRVSIEGLRASGREHFGGHPASVEAEITQYIDESDFAKRHPDTHTRWLDAQVLLRAEPTRYATQVGHNCREALASMANGLVHEHGADVAPGAGTREKLAAVLAKIDSPTQRKFLNALVAYWLSVSDLAQRQEHAGLRENENLTEEDTRRVLFQTMLVMYEVDRALARPHDT